MLINDNQYLSVIESIKSEISKAQYNAVLQVNKEMTMLYYHIGEIINAHKSWGNKFIDNLAKDIKLAYPNSSGYSVRNLKYMAKFAAEYPDAEFVQQAVAQIPWGQNIVLLDKITDKSIRRWYIEKIIENGWSRNVLVHQIESGLYERQAVVKKISNFEKLLPAPQSELAKQTMKDPYVFDFIPFKEDKLNARNSKEREINEKFIIFMAITFLLPFAAFFCVKRQSDDFAKCLITVL